ncbi:MAG: hypothetical protein KAQ69_01815 [Spirochaetales bacterium]|nr:hypothetical protein [Spirochaetales bacterium]
MNINNKKILISPYYIEPDLHNLMRKTMDSFRNIVQKLADEYRLTYVDTQKAFDCYLEFKAPDTLSADKIHPNQIGHMIIAKEILKQLVS